MSKERPILFSSPMVLAILEGRKTQTRRIVSPKLLGQPNYCLDTIRSERRRILPECPYGQPGDVLWVRETIRRAGAGACWYAADNKAVYGTDEHTGLRMLAHYKYKRDVLPSIHMPKDWCRIRLEVTGVRLERVQEITCEDVAREGVYLTKPELSVQFGVDVECRSCFADLWDKINGNGSWNANPWVWVVEFRRL